MGKKKIADILALARPAEKSADVCLRADLQADLQDIDNELSRFRKWEPTSLSEADPRAELAGRREAVLAEMREATVTFRFRALPAKAYSDLVALHPPRDEDRKDRLAFNLETFPAALVAACSVDPEMTLEDAEALFERLAVSQRDKLFNAAWTCNQFDVSVPFSAPDSQSPASSGQK